MGKATCSNSDRGAEPGEPQGVRVCSHAGGFPEKAVGSKGRGDSGASAKNIINLISVWTIWRCPCVESSPVSLEEGVCYDQCILLAKLY